jgi:GT2 family glycosyltransferase
LTLVNAKGERLLKIAVLTPRQDTVGGGFSYDRSRLFGSNGGLMIFEVRGTIIPQSRAALANAAIEAGATHLLWIDSDMRFPPDSLARLLNHDKPIVAANYTTRRPPYLPTAETKNGFLFTSPDSDGLVEVSHCGMGLMLVDTEVMRTIGEPFFAIGFNPKDKQYVGEDFYFCKKARDHGFKVYVDQGLSKEVRHVGEVEFTYEHALETQARMIGGTN